MNVWYDRDIRVGEQWNSRILAAIARSRVAVLLVNHQFFGSTFVCQQELPALVAAAREGLLTLVCIPIGAVDHDLLKFYGLSDFQFTHDIKRPLTKLSPGELDEAIVSAAIQIKEAYGAPPGTGFTDDSAVRLGEPLQAQASALPGPLFGVPSLNAHYLPRAEDLAVLTARVLGGTELGHGVTSAAGIHGMGGLGKTVMAQAVCNDDSVRRAFPDGIAWITLGETPDLLMHSNRVLSHFNPTAPAAQSLYDAKSQLQRALSGHRALIVIDDLWDARHFEPFDVAEGGSRTLVTTRDATVLTQIGARALALQCLTKLATLQLLARWNAVEVEDLPQAASDVAVLTRGLPLAVALSGALVADGVAWDTLAHQLRAGQLRFLDHPNSSIYVSLDRSVLALPEAQRERYLELAVFPEDVAVDSTVVATLWSHSGGLSSAETEKLLRQLERKALLSISGKTGSFRVGLHDLLRDFLRLRCADIASLHATLLDAFRISHGLAEGGAGWAALPRGETYLWRWLTWHLAAAGMTAELESALLDLGWIRSRLSVETRTVEGRDAADVGALRADFQRAAVDSPAQIVGRVLLASSHVLTRHPEALEQQLFGRLGSRMGTASGRLEEVPDAALAALARNCRAVTERNDGLLPEGASLTPPGSMELILEMQPGSDGGANYVLGALALADGRRALSWSNERLQLWDLQGLYGSRVLGRPEGSIRDVTLLSGGTRALSWSDVALQVWDLEGAKAPRLLGTHQGTVNGAAVLPDGRRVLSWSSDKTLRLWNLETGDKPKVMAGHQEGVDGALLLGDGEKVLSWSDYDHTFRLWNLSDAAEPRVLAGHQKAVGGAVLLPDRVRALSWSYDSTLRIFDLQSIAEPLVLEGHLDAVKGALVLADGRRALSWSWDGTLRLWDLADATALQTLSGHRADVTGALLLPDRRRALSWSDDGTLRLWDLDDVRPLRVFSGHTGKVEGALLLPGGRRVLSWASDNTLRIWDLDGDSHSRVLGHYAQVRGARLLSDGLRAVSWSGDGTLRVWSLEDAAELPAAIGHKHGVNGAALAPDSRHALSWSWAGTLALSDLTSVSAPRILTGHRSWINGAALLPDGRKALSWSDDETLRLWSLFGNVEPKVLTGHTESIRSAVLFPDGRRALSCSNDRTLRLWDMETASQLQVLTGHEDSIHEVVLLPDGRRVLSRSTDTTLRLWDPTGNPEPRVLVGHKGNVEGILLLADGRRAISWSRDHPGYPRSNNFQLFVWDISAASDQFGLVETNDDIAGAIAIPDGKSALVWGRSSLWLLDTTNASRRDIRSEQEGSLRGALPLPGERVLLWSDDATLCLLSLNSTDRPVLLVGHEGPVRGAALHPDGRHLISWAADRTLKLWDLRSVERPIATYFLDAVISIALIAGNSNKVFVGDSSGAVQVLTIRSRSRS